jgi:cytochrome P450
VPAVTAELLRRETALIGWKRKAQGTMVLADGSAIPAGRQILTLIGVAGSDVGVA